MSLLVEVSIGEFIDKLSILNIKAGRIKDQVKLKNIRKEINSLQETWKRSQYIKGHIEEEIHQLKQTNEKLWEIEDKIRIKEVEKEFDREFIELARLVYITNDERSRIKRRINEKLNSELYEEKSYSNYK